MACKDICKRYKAQGRVSGGRYRNGQKRCQICDLFIKFEGIFCPCCGNRLRNHPRNLKQKQKMTELMGNRI